MTTNHDGFSPTWNKLWNITADDRFAEHNATENVTNGAVWRLPHFLQAKFFDASFVRGDGCALHANTMLQNCVRRVNRYLVVCGIAVLHTKVVVLKIDVEVRQDEAVLYELPDDASHLVSVEFNYWIINLDLCHGKHLFSEHPYRVATCIRLVHNSVMAKAAPYHLY